MPDQHDEFDAIMGSLFGPRVNWGAQTAALSAAHRRITRKALRAALDAEPARMAAIVAANDALLDAFPLDVEHTIECHSDTLPEMYRALSEASENALGILQVEIHAMLDRNLPVDAEPVGEVEPTDRAQAVAETVYSEFMTLATEHATHEDESIDRDSIARALTKAHAAGEAAAMGKVRGLVEGMLRDAIAGPVFPVKIDALQALLAKLPTDGAG